MSAGAYSEAMGDYLQLSHWRKAGDACFAMGRLDEARGYYERGENVPGEDYQAWRGGPDNDRLIALAIGRDDWAEVLRIIRVAEPDPFGPSQVIFGGSSRAKGPLMKICAHAAVAQGDPSMEREMRKFFGLKAAEVAVLIEHARSGGYAKDVSKFASPPMLRVPMRSIEEIQAEGDTEQAREIAALFDALDVDFAEACSNFAIWRDAGDEVALSRIIYWLTRSSSFDLLRSCLAALTNEVGLYDDYGDRAVAFYCSHPWVTRASMRELLRALVTARAVPTAAVLLSCVLQNSASMISEIEKGRFDPHRTDPLAPVRGHPGWAEGIISEAIAGGKFDGLWSRVCAEADQQPYKDVRRGTAFSDLCDFLGSEIKAAWERDLARIRWKSEESAYLALQSLLPDMTLERHAMPAWLAPQHLDIFLPEAGIAVEYQGEQHYRPLEVFGGEAGYEATRRRDENKARLCKLAGIRLEYIRYDDDVMARLEEISASARRAPRRAARY